MFIFEAIAAGIKLGLILAFGLGACLFTIGLFLCLVRGLYRFANKYRGDL